MRHKDQGAVGCQHGHSDIPGVVVLPASPGSQVTGERIKPGIPGDVFGWGYPGKTVREIREYTLWALMRVH